MGTLGGGIRRIEMTNGAFQDTLHLTREDGLASNLIFAIAVAPDEAVWAATDDGVSRIQEVNGALSITNYTSIDGLSLPVRDLAVDQDGAVWVATDGGLFRISNQGREIAGTVQDETGQSVAGTGHFPVGYRRGWHRRFL